MIPAKRARPATRAAAWAVRAIVSFVTASAVAQPVAPLPPLPPAMAAQGPGEQRSSPWPSVGLPPLGDNSDDESGDAAQEPSEGQDGLADNERAARGSADAPSSMLGDDPSRSQAARSSGRAVAFELEGPPVPLAPAGRLSEGSSAERGAGDASASGQPLTMRFKNAELVDVLDAFSRFTGLNIIASERARGRVSLNLNGVPWRIAFDALLDMQGLAMSRRGNVIWVAPLAELAARERQRFEAHARAADLEPLASRTFALNYPRAEEVQRLLTAAGAQRVLSKRGAAMADARTNLLFVTDLAARLEQVAQLIAAIDKPNRQVLIEARIVEGARGFSRELGARLSMRSAGGAADTAGAPARGLVGGEQGVVHDLSARAIAGFEAATAGLTLFAAGATRLVTAELSALEALGRGQIVSSPRVVTADRTRALVEQGTELPYQAKVRNGVSGVQFRRASLKLEVEPRITPAGRVILDLDIAKDSVGKATAGGPAIDTKHVRTRVEVEDGGTVSIGGIYESEDRDDVTRVPLLGKIPLLGALFRHRAVREQRSELVVFITPRVVAID
ncbi:type IV pilus secretin PilQ [Trinickia sp.]|uniref:type IV pilus secretin PilQ n=1 Tax=Trinickia sp. TaxID=2571163 RepID=UPI003F7E5618